MIKNSLAIYRKILRIDQLIAAELYPSIQDFMDDDDIGGSRATIYRLLERMKDDLNAPIEFSQEKKGYFYSQKAFRLPIVFTTEQELFATAVLKNLSEKLKGTPLYESSKNLLSLVQDSTVKNPVAQSFLRDFNPEDNAEIDWISDRYIFLNDTHPSIDENTWNQIKFAMEKFRVAKIMYWGYEYTVYPYQVLYSENSWYLWAYVPAEEDKRLFFMDEISEISVTNEKFSLPKDFSFTNYSNGTYGAFRGNKEYNFKIQFYDWAIRYAKKINFGKNLVFAEENDRLTVTFTATELLPILKMVLSYGKCAKPLEPKELVDMWKENIREMELAVKTVDSLEK